MKNDWNGTIGRPNEQNGLSKADVAIECWEDVEARLRDRPQRHRSRKPDPGAMPSVASRT